MNTFYDWKEVLAMKGLREAVFEYAMAEAPEYLEDGADGVKGLSDDDYPYVLERAIKEKGECVFYFSRGADDQIQDHTHRRCRTWGQAAPYEVTRLNVAEGREFRSA